MRNQTLFLLIAVLLLHLFIRVHNIEELDAFIDEAYHISRATVVYDFEANPGRFAHGKVLLYYYLGLFEGETFGGLPTARFATALFSVLNGALLYLIGRRLHSSAAGLLAAFLYAVLPFAFFFERMALADSFAGTFAAFAAWRSLIFAKKPSMREGAILGLLLAMTTLAKLTLGLIPFLPAAAALIYLPWRGLLPTLREWVKRYWPPLILAAIVLLLAWLPLLIPAGLALRTDDRFILVDPMNLQQLESTTVEEQLPWMLSSYMTWGGLLAVLLSGLMILRIQGREGAFLWAWILLSIMLSIIAATRVRTRYLAPAAVPSVLVVSIVSVWLWERSNSLIRVGLVGLLAAWVTVFALPFAYTSATNAPQLALNEYDWVRYLSSNFSGEALIQSADTLNQEDIPTGGTYITWGMCQLVALYTPHPLTCLPSSSHQAVLSDALIRRLSQTLPPEGYAYVVKNSDTKQMDTPNIVWRLVARYSRPNIARDVEIWELRWSDQGGPSGEDSRQ